MRSLLRAWTAAILVVGVPTVAGAEGNPDPQPIDPYAEPQPAPLNADEEAVPLNPYVDEAPPAKTKKTKGRRAQVEPPAAPVPNPAPIPEPAFDPSVLSPYAPFKVVGVMLETGQTLLWDEQDGEYKLARVGNELHGWRVVAIESDVVVVVSQGVRDELPLVPAPTVQRPAGDRKKLPPIVVGAHSAPEASTPPTPPTPAAPPAPPQPPPPPKVVEEKRTLTRAEIDRALADFDALMKSISVAANPGGGFVIRRLDEKSWLHNIGLRSGDVVHTIAGQQVSTVDDAARVYAQLRTATAIAVELERASQKMALRYDIK